MQQIIDFILELDKLKHVTRKTRLRGTSRHENSAEHSWQIALLAWSLADYAAEPVNLDQVIKLLLVHDIGEIDTGDTIAYAQIDWVARKEEELQAVRRIFGLLPAAQGDALVALWQEFEERQTPEARFAHAVDRAMPCLLNLANHGQSWKENGIGYEQVVATLGPPISEGCPALWAYMYEQLEAARAQRLFGGAIE